MLNNYFDASFVDKTIPKIIKEEILEFKESTILPSAEVYTIEEIISSLVLKKYFRKSYKTLLEEI